MSTKKTMQFSLLNTTDSVAEMWVSHRCFDLAVTLRLITPPAPDGVDRYQFPQSTAYHATGVKPGHSLAFALEYAAGAGAGMDYWFVAVALSGGSGPGAFSFGGSTLLPTAAAKVPDSGQFSALIEPAPPFDAPRIWMRTGADEIRTWMHVDKTFNPKPTVRKSVAALTAAERDTYVKAVKALKQSPSRLSPPTRSRYDDYVLVHMLAMNQVSVTDRTKPIDNGNITVGGGRIPMWAHESPAFVPWHREFLRQFEHDLQGVTQNRQIGIPYWDWTVNFAPDGPPWTADFMGGDGHDGPVTTGPFAGHAQWPLTLSGDGVDHLVRGFGRQADYERLPMPVEATTTLSAQTYDAAQWDSEPTLDTFRNRLEGFNMKGFPSPHTGRGMHNLVHVWVGGNRGTMLPGSSPNDPVFFLHHCNVDRLWWHWQLAQGSMDGSGQPATPLYEPIDPIPGRPGQSLKQPMIFMDPAVSSSLPWSDPPATPEQVVSHHAMNYMYDTDA